MRIASLILAALLLISAAPALAHSHDGEETTQSGMGSDESRPLQATYEPNPDVDEGAYTGRYFFAMSRGVANSTMHPAVQAPLFLLTIPLDIVLLPVAVIAGFF